MREPPLCFLDTLRILLPSELRPAPRLPCCVAVASGAGEDCCDLRPHFGDRNHRCSLRVELCRLPGRQVAKERGEGGRVKPHLFKHEGRWDQRWYRRGIDGYRDLLSAYQAWKPLRLPHKPHLKREWNGYRWWWAAV